MRNHSICDDTANLDRARVRPSVAVAVTALTMLFLGFATARAASSLPEGPGLAARYPRDSGIGNDPGVVLAEDFEKGAISDLGSRWNGVSNDDGRVLSFSDEVPSESAGKRSLKSMATVGRNTGGHLYKVLPREADRLFARFYVRFDSTNAYTHHFVTVGGYRPSTPWPQGGAGERPRGDDRITIGIEPALSSAAGPPGVWNFYAYWHEMKKSADGRFWGNGLHPIRPQPIPRGRWQCVEIMVRLNSEPEKADGDLALWLDGSLVAHFGPGARRGPWSGMGFDLRAEGGEAFEGFRWRNSADLRLNFFWLMHYVTDRTTPPGGVNTVWFDDIVVATEYIGPLQPVAQRRSGP